MILGPGLLVRQSGRAVVFSQKEGDDNRVQVPHFMSVFIEEFKKVPRLSSPSFACYCGISRYTVVDHKDIVIGKKVR